MTGPGPEDGLAAAFEEQRGRLVAVAHRMLGSQADAEDAVQEAWLRLARTGGARPDALIHPGGLCRAPARYVSVLGPWPGPGCAGLARPGVSAWR